MTYTDEHKGRVTDDEIIDLEEAVAILSGLAHGRGSEREIHAAELAKAIVGRIVRERANA